MANGPENNMGDNSHEVPVIDFASFLNGSAKQSVADEILASFKSIGFVYIINHGMPLEEIQEMFNWVSLIN